MAEHVDVVVIGAGLSGVAAGYYLGQRGTRYVILEARDAIGGTWDLFRYPGVRSDSDMFTLGYSFAPWQGDAALADGPSILAYVRATATAHGVDRQIRFGRRVVGAAWSSATAQWTLTVEHAATGARETLTCRFVIGCTGYYAYDAGYTPPLPGLDAFGGTVVHPQHWPADLDVAGQRVVVLGSGATAVTLVPALAARGARVTMLQRSPTYVVSRPARDPNAAAWRARLGASIAQRLLRLKYAAGGVALYQLCRRLPGLARRTIEQRVAAALPPGYDVARHFSPRYDPWDQRLCLVPDDDLFAAIASGAADVVTDEIAGFEAGAIRLRGGATLPADLLVTATGLRLSFLGGVPLAVDGRTVEPGRTHLYKGTLLAGVPNLAIVVGYTNASWTLKAELALRYTCRLLDELDRRGARAVTPVAPADVGDAPALELTSGYVERSRDVFPRQGRRAPWRLFQAYPLDVVLLGRGPHAHRDLRFS